LHPPPPLIPLPQGERAKKEGIPFRLRRVYPEYARENCHAKKSLRKEFGINPHPFLPYGLQSARAVHRLSALPNDAHYSSHQHSSPPSGYSGQDPRGEGKIAVFLLAKRNEGRKITKQQMQTVFSSYTTIVSSCY